MPETKNRHIIKTRDDHAPVVFERDDTPSDAAKPYKLSCDANRSWIGSETHFGPEVLRSRIEPWLSALFQSEHLSLLVGSGLTHAIHRMATDQSLAGMASTKFGVFDEEITKEAERVAKAAGRNTGNFEDQMRAATELLRGLDILSCEALEADGINDRREALRTSIDTAIVSFSNSILDGERNLRTAPPERRTAAFNYLVEFLMSFASRSAPRDRLNLFTTNYDRYIEAGADIAGLRIIDRFVGTLAPVFRASRLDIDIHYNPPGIRGEPRYLEGVVRFAKLHGSVDWVDHDGAIRRASLPFGAENLAQISNTFGTNSVDGRQLMVYPNAAKDRETADHPYVELFRDFAAAICRPNSTLVTYGYSFGDEHINRVIGDMLTIPSTHLVIIAYDDRLGRIMGTYRELGRPAQMTLLIGSHLGDLQTLVDRYLPKSAIDRTSIRMAELLQARWTTARSDMDSTQQPSSDQ